MAKTVILIRHAQALHNVAPQDYSIPDPELSEKGREQCSHLREHFTSNTSTIPADLRSKIRLILTSPMRRTCETAMLALGDFAAQHNIPIVAHAGWQENSAKPCDTGSEISKVTAEFPKIDLSHVDPIYPDKTSPAGAVYAYNRAALVARGQSVVKDLAERPEEVIVVVSHSGFLRQCVTGRWFYNADYRIFDVKKTAADGESEELYRLEEWESTAKGGMGWSFEDKIVIGKGLPEGAAPATSETPPK